MFVSFLTAPTIVSLIEDEADVSMVYSLTEEEIQKELKEIKAGPEIEFQFVAHFLWSSGGVAFCTRVGRKCRRTPAVHAFPVPVTEKL